MSEKRQWEGSGHGLDCYYLAVNIFCKSTCMHACNEGIVMSEATSGAVWPCGYVRIR